MQVCFLLLFVARETSSGWCCYRATQALQGKGDDQPVGTSEDPVGIPAAPVGVQQEAVGVLQEPVGVPDPLDALALDLSMPPALQSLQ